MDHPGPQIVWAGENLPGPPNFQAFSEARRSTVSRFKSRLLSIPSGGYNGAVFDPFDWGRTKESCMQRKFWRWAVGLAPLALMMLWATRPATGQAPAFSTQNGEWQTYGGDLRSTRYSPLDQINAD